MTKTPQELIASYPIDQLIDKLPRTSAVSRQEGKALRQLAAQVNPGGVIVEIGSCSGISTCYLRAGAFPGVAVHAIDLWTGGEGIQAEEFIERAFWTNLATMGYTETVSVHKGFSDMIAQEWKLPISMLFIDGDHSYKAVLTDLSSWVPFLAPGGTLVMHDHDRIDTVRYAAEEYLGRQIVNRGTLIQRRLWYSQLSKEDLNVIRTANS